MHTACQLKYSIKSESCYKSFCASLSVTYPKELKVLKRSNTLKLRYWCMNCGPNISNMGKWVKRTILWSLLGQLLDPKFLLLQLTGQAMSGSWTVSLLLLVVVVELIKNLKALICSSFLFCKVIRKESLDTIWNAIQEFFPRYYFASSWCQMFFIPLPFKDNSYC